MNKYTAKPGSPIDDDQAQIVGEETESMEREGIPLTPRMLLERARDKTRAIHALFNWNDVTAAEQHRVTWAGTLFRSLCSIDIRTQERVKEFYSIEVRERPGAENLPNRIYESRRKVLIDDDARRQLSLEFFKKLSGICSEVESLGLEKDFGEWRHIILAVRTNAPTMSFV